MVPAAAACAGDVLPVCAAERVRAAIVCQRLQGPVDGGEPGPVTGRPQLGVQVLGARHDAGTCRNGLTLCCGTRTLSILIRKRFSV